MPELTAERADRLARLRATLTELGTVVVAFSGGADSALLAWVANDTLGFDRCQVMTAVSPSLAPEEEAECRALAAEWRLNWRALPTDELANLDYVANDGERCYHCKAALMDVAAVLAASAAGGAVIVLGVNGDDLDDHRPGQRAAAERGARFPLVEAGLDKADVRAISAHLGLRTWDKPAAACLASRLPYGTPVSVGTLAVVAAAESAVRALGFRQVRVRHYGDLARLELDLGDLAEALERREELVAAVQAAGYRYVTLDLEGFRSGNLNRALVRRGGEPA
jgi:uncharacterized protein